MTKCKYKIYNMTKLSRFKKYKIYNMTKLSCCKFCILYLHLPSKFQNYNMTVSTMASSFGVSSSSQS